MTDQRYSQAGVTIVELVATIVILGIALVAVAAMVRRGLGESADIMLETRAIALGHAYLDEIVGRRFDERSSPNGLRPCFGLPPGPDTCTLEANFGPDGAGETRPRFDDVDDYHGLAEGDGEVTPLQDAEGNVRPGYENFRVEVTVRYAGTDPVLGRADVTHAKLITVNVRHRTQPDGWDFSVYRGNY